MLFAARFGNQAIPKLFESSTVFLEVDLDGNFSTLLIGNELDSAHPLILALLAGDSWDG